MSTKKQVPTVKKSHKTSSAAGDTWLEAELSKLSGGGGGAGEDIKSSITNSSNNSLKSSKSDLKTL
jgi:hypothetical protein